MRTHCQHCGEELPPVNDAFCSFCHERLSDAPTPGKQSSYDIGHKRPGRTIDLGQIATMLFCAVALFTLYWFLLPIAWQFYAPSPDSNGWVLRPPTHFRFFGSGAFMALSLPVAQRFLLTRQNDSPVYQLGVLRLIKYSLIGSIYLAFGIFYLFSFTEINQLEIKISSCLLYTSPSPRDRTRSRMPSSA